MARAWRILGSMHGVEHVDDEVDEHVGDGEDDDAALHDEEVAPEDGLDGELAHAGEGEDHLDDDGAADEGARR